MPGSTLYEILLDALAAEHGMRLLAAESALEWLDDSTVTTARRLSAARSERSRRSCWTLFPAAASDCVAGRPDRNGQRGIARGREGQRHGRHPRCSTTKLRPATS